ncbi:hypothetical protein MYCTH_91334 [Thermothelomyces thermophilus ATCC 42464]|uniref:Uncharacterized protein n=1 Tax=Thermothelomyces thermophilus (strain ATCC 42464 / BCRC 31852 / DSM 1799) TaxID=573729 RepID=G2Q5W5_THET4|nr:uncharacterized protein MYCTH_91334 [Thermothelomyces thermophilus ATCC 42464]AEO53841.1 hypothetical protein MYCTH_91334 [Thermothelomyces thermophilus ATCC 42464]
MNPTTNKFRQHQQQQQQQQGMPSFCRQQGRGKAVGPDSSAAAGASSGGPGAPGAGGAVSDSSQSGRKRKRKRGEASLFAYVKRAVRDVPCLMCVKSALAGRSSGECRNHSGPGKRCYHCAKGSHKCREVYVFIGLELTWLILLLRPASCVSSAKELTKALEIDPKHWKSKSLRIILRNDLERAGVEDDDQPREDNEDDKELASFTKIGRAVFEVITEVDAIRKMRTRRAALEQLGLAAADEGDDDDGLDNWPGRDTQRYPSWLVKEEAC